MANFTGTNGPDTIIGGLGDDFISGLQGDDSLVGGSGNDEIVGWQGTDTIRGGSGNDTLSGISGNDRIYGEDGDDVLNAYDGTQLLDGGLGNDTFNTGTIPLLPALTNLTMSGGGGDDLFYLDQIGSLVNTTIVGGSGYDVIIFEDLAAFNIVTSDIEIARGSRFAVNAGALDGVQLISASSGSNIQIELLSGGASTLRFGSSSVIQLLGSGGGDLVSAVSASVVNAFLGDGNDSLASGSGADSVEAGAGDDSISSGDGNDTIYGEAGSNLISSGAGEDFIICGNAILGSQSGIFNDTIDAGQGNDYIVVSQSGSFAIQRATVNGGDGIDTLRLEGRMDLTYASIEKGVFNYIEMNAGLLNGIGSIEELTAGGSRSSIVLLTQGSSVFRPIATMRATVTGTSGADNVTVSSGNSGWFFDMDSGADVISAAAGADSIYGGSGDDQLFGNDGNDYLQADYGADLLDGGAGDDRLIGSISGGNSTLRGGAGADTISGDDSKPFNEGRYDLVSYEGSTAAVMVDLETGATSGGHADGDQINFVYGVIGSVFGDTISGDDLPSELRGGAGADALDGRGGMDLLLGEGGADSIFGGASNDSMLGGAGNDWLDGGIGADSLIGGADSDTYFVDDVGDMVVELTGEGTDLVFSSVSHTLRANVENLTFTGSGNTTGIGNGLANILVGNSGNNILDGGTGADGMRGGAGNDRYTFDNIGDTASELVGEGTDTVIASVAHTLRANFENLTIIGTATNAFGSSVANILTGNGLNNILNGKEANDVLVGGAGLDTFMFDTTLGATNVDRITDFNVVDDTFRLDDAFFAGLPLGGLAATAFRAGSSAGEASHRIIYDQATGRVFHDADGAGGVAQVLFAILDNKPATLSHLDFVVT